MSEITVSGINKYFGDFHLLRGASMEIFEGERAGIVGPNGCGKTTLLKIISGLEGVESGSVSVRAGRRIGLLEQLPDYGSELTVREVLWRAFDHIEQMAGELADIERRMETGENADMRRYSTLQTAFESAGGYDLELAYRRMVNGLKIDPDMQEREFSSLSGGEKTRVNLARLMLSGTDILLLDEPTNHLDLQSIEWLEGYLRAFKGTVLIVSHDRYFLDQVTSRTLELLDGEITSWPGNYSYFADKKQELAEQLEAAKKRQDKEIARLSFTVERMKGWGIGNKKLMRRAFAMEKRVERIERIETIRKHHKMKNRFTLARQSGEDVYVIDNLSAGYDRPLIKDFSAMIFRGERIAILGPNGCGKTTLLNTLLRTLPPLGGRFYEGVGLKMGLLPQVVSFDHPYRTLIDTLLFDTNCSTQQARDRLASFGFKGEDVFKTVNVLSGGEKTRLKLCIFMYSQVNTLFLDEPTNHLDILSREWIEDAIDDFSETMLFISHDRYFLSRFATRIWAVEDGRVEDFLGTFEEYQQAVTRRAAPRPEPRPSSSPPSQPAEQKPRTPNLSPRELEKRRRERERLIARAEALVADLDSQMQSCPAEEYVRLSELFEQKQVAEAELLDLYAEDE